MSPQELAEACARAMWNDDSASQRLGMRLDHIAPGAASLSMTVTEQMLNGHGDAHGGYLFTLADSAFAFACNTYNQVSVAQNCAIAFLAPGALGDRLIAVAKEIHRSERSGIYDVSVARDDGAQIAELRGYSRTIKRTLLTNGDQ